LHQTGKLNEVAFEKTTAPLQKELAQLKTEIDVLIAEAALKRARHPNLEDKLGKSPSRAEVWVHLEFEERRSWVESFLVGIKVGREGNVKMTFNQRRLGV
jgi:hypothetical protein